MKRHLALSIILFLSINLHAQFGFSKIFGLDTLEYNRVNQVIEHEGYFYCSGEYAEASIGYYNAFIGIFDEKGNYINHHLIENDTISIVNINNYVNYDGSTYSVFGRKSHTTYILTYDFQLDTFYVSHEYNHAETGTYTWGGVVTDPLSNQTFVCGSKHFSGNSKRDFRVYTIIENDTIYYIKNQPEKHIIPLNSRLNNNNELVVIGLNGYGNGYKHLDSTFVMIFDNELNVLKSTYGTDMQALGYVDKGMYIDSNNEIVCTHEKRYLLDTTLVGSGPNDDLSKPGVMKFDKNGAHLWTMEIGNNINNEDGRGRWNSIIESNEKDGYIIVGAEGYFSNDTLLTEAAIAKVSTDGDSLWMRRYSYERQGRFAQDVFTDISPTADGGYIVVGHSFGADSADPLPPEYSVLLKLNNDGLVDTTVSTVIILDDPSTVTVYPNPTSGPLYIENNGNESYKIDLINIHGQRLKTYKMRNGPHTIAISPHHFTDNGLYFLRVYDQNGIVNTKKIMVSK